MTAARARQHRGGRRLWSTSAPPRYPRVGFPLPGGVACREGRRSVGERRRCWCCAGNCGVGRGGPVRPGESLPRRCQLWERALLSSSFHFAAGAFPRGALGRSVPLGVSLGPGGASRQRGCLAQILLPGPCCRKAAGTAVLGGFSAGPPPSRGAGRHKKLSWGARAC